MEACRCTICGTAATGQSESPESGPYVNCPRCGVFWFDREAWQAFKIHFVQNPPEVAEVTRAVASHVFRRSQRKGETHYPPITKAIWDEILVRKLPTPTEQADYLILWVGDNLALPEATVEVLTAELAATIGSGVGGGLLGFWFIYQELSKQGLIRGETVSVGGHETKTKLSLTFDGWSKYRELKQSVSESRTGFMAMSFNHGASFKMYRDSFVPAAVDAGFALRRVDSIAKPGLIDVKMMVDIRAAAFIVADLTGHSHGAYWEAGFAAGLGKPVIYTCQEADFKAPGTHFDVNHHTTILWDADKPEKARNELKAMIRNALPDTAKLTDET